MNSNGLIMSDEQNVETVVDAVTSTISIEPIEISSSINGHDHHHLNLLYLDETELEIDTELEAETIIHQNGTDTIPTEDETKTSEYLFDCSIDQHETTDNESDCDDSSSIGSIVEIRTNNSVASFSIKKSNNCDDENVNDNYDSTLKRNLAMEVQNSSIPKFSTFTVNRIDLNNINNNNNSNNCLTPTITMVNNSNNENNHHPLTNGMVNGQQPPQQQQQQNHHQPTELDEGIFNMDEFSTDLNATLKNGDSNPFLSNNNHQLKVIKLSDKHQQQHQQQQQQISNNNPFFIIKRNNHGSQNSADQNSANPPSSSASSSTPVSCTSNIFTETRLLNSGSSIESVSITPLASSTVATAAAATATTSSSAAAISMTNTALNIIPINNVVNNQMMILQEKYPQVILLQEKNSCPFIERRFNLSGPIKIGRAIARVRPSSDNAIFDCKVLSRNHALMWHQDGKFYLRDTCSSNGTFINNVRLSLANEKSNPQEIFSGDCLQFGIEVTEKKQIHNCVIATVRLFQPDGTEAKPEGNVAPVYNGMVDHFSNKSLNSSLQYINSEIITPFQLFELAHYLQEAQSKQMMLEEQIDKMKTLITTAVESTKSGWNSVFAEDQLLTRIESLQSKFEVVLFARAHDDDTFSMEQRESIIETLKNELLDLINEKERFKNQWKFAIAKAFEEKTTAQTNLYSVELQLHTKSEHCKQLELTIKQNLKEMENLINGLDKAHNDFHELTTKLRLTEDEATKMRSQLETDKNNLEKQIFALKEENIAHLKMIAKQQDEIGMNGSMKKDVSNCESVMISTIKHETKIGLTIETSQQTDNDDNGLSEFHHQSLQAELIELKELYNGQCVQLRSQQDELTRFNRWLTENGPKCRQFWHILNENLTKIDKKLNEKYRKLSKLIDDLYCFIGKFNKAKGIVLNEIKVLKENNEILKMNSAESNETIGQLNVVINNCEQNLNELRIKHEQVLEEKNQLLLKVEHQQYEKAKLEMSTAKTMVSTLIQTDPMLEEQSNQQQQQQQQFQLPHDSLDSSKQSNEIQNEQLKQIVNLLKDRVPNYSEEESLLAKLNVLLDDGERLRNENSQLSANLYNVQQQYTLLSYQNELSFCMALFPLVIIFIAIILAFYPILSYIMGTSGV